MKKTQTIEQTVSYCDFCKTETLSQCSICQTDLCRKCAIVYRTSKNYYFPKLCPSCEENHPEFKLLNNEVNALEGEINTLEKVIGSKMTQFLKLIGDYNATYSKKEIEKI